jgi:hypothetical protein
MRNQDNLLYHVSHKKGSGGGGQLVEYDSTKAMSHNRLLAF